jgi:hypothetical protein
MLAPSDPWDPNTWQPTDHEFRIYGDDQAQTWAVVDEIDYHWAIQWRWNWKRSPCGKMYLRRAVGENANGQRLRTYTLYLHVEILKRTGVQPPSPLHTIADHRDSNSHNNRRNNLRWLTPKQNGRNRFGRHATDLFERD